MMSRLLPVIAIVLLALIVLGRAARDPVPESAPPAAPAPELVASPSVGGGSRPVPTPGAEATGAAAPFATPNIDRLVTLASRQRIDRERRYTFIDSLLLTSDSLVRRWADRNGRALRVALVEPSDLPGWRGAALPTIARRAFAAWQETYPDLRFEVTPDVSSADITVRWVEKFELERTGQTDLQYVPTGAIQHADITLALQTQEGQPLRDEGLLAVAIHEVGHALGLPHSGSPQDVMFPDTRTGTISSRDRATLVLLYAVAVGSLRMDP